MNKFDRLIQDQDNIRQQEEQEHQRERTRSKIVLCMPHEKGVDLEYGNALEMFDGILRDNPDYSIIECDKCEDCGIINETVERTHFDDPISGEPKSMLLCTYCAITSAGMT